MEGRGGVKQREGKRQAGERKHREEGKGEEREPQTQRGGAGVEERAFRDEQNRRVYRDRKTAG